MNINTEILRNYFKDFIIFYEIDAGKDAETSVTKALAEIQSEIQNESCCDLFETIVSVFEKYNLTLGTKHNF